MLRITFTLARTKKQNLARLVSTANGNFNVDFNDSEICFKSKSVKELFRARAVFTICKIKILTDNALHLMKLSYSLLGTNTTNYFLSKSFFGHFCAGEDDTSIKPTVQYLENNGIGSILDYAAESDVKPEDAVPPVVDADARSSDAIQCRVYDYKNEALCDEHSKTFAKCIEAVKNVSPTGFAAIKLTALGNPELLKRASKTLIELKKLFYKIDKHKTGQVSREQFFEVFSKTINGKDSNAYFDSCDVDLDNKVNYIDWTNGLTIEQLRSITAHCTEEGPLFASVLDDNEVQLLRNMKTRIYKLVDLASSLGVRLMIDAEHSYFQPAIDNITTELAKKYNKKDKIPVVFNTYQMYLKDSQQRLLTDMERAKTGDYKFAAKLVRGAYMVLEHEYAKENNIEDPIHNTIEDTHNNYNRGIEEAIKKMSRGEDIEIMVATHNQQSIEYTLQSMLKHNLKPSSNVYFGQLLGMSDYLTFALGNNGYKAYKYVPYGKIQEVMPYLIRRAQENADALSGAKKEIKLIDSELHRRFKLVFKF
jgi:proline dehydrogenase